MGVFLTCVIHMIILHHRFNIIRAKANDTWREVNSMKKAYDAPQIVELGTVNSYVQAEQPVPGVTDVPGGTTCTLTTNCVYAPSA